MRQYRGATAIGLLLWLVLPRAVNVFGSVALRVLEPVSVIADWTGQDLFLAASVAPFDSVPLVVTPGLADVTGALRPTSAPGGRFITTANAVRPTQYRPRIWSWNGLEESGA